MKRILLLAITLMVAHLAAQNWQTLNNTNHVYTMEKDGNSIYFSTWGGVVQITGESGAPLSLMQQTQHWTTGEGLVSNDIRSMAMIDFSQSLWFGSGADGISIISDAGMQSLDSSLGLPALRINEILEMDSRILVATSQGLAVFYYLPGVNFPLMLNQYNVINTNGGLSDNNISDIMLTDHGTLFLATGSGVDFVHVDSLHVNSAWHSLRAQSPIPVSPRYLLTANHDTIVVATQTQVYLNSLDLDEESWELIDPHNEQVSMPISALKLAENGKLWIAYGDWDENLMRFGLNSELLLSSYSAGAQIEEFRAGTNGMGFNPISRIHEFDNQIYLCTWGDGIARWESGTWNYFYPNSIGFPRITSSMAAMDNSLWFSSGNIGDHLVPKGTLGVSKFKDGVWQNYDIHNSPLGSDNILSIAVDGQDRKWFGAWDTDYINGPWFPAISILDERDDSWKRLTKWGIAEYNEGVWSGYLPGSARILGNTVGGMAKDQHNNMLVLCYDDGVSVINSDLEHLSDFQLPGSTFQRVLNAYHNGRQYFFGTEYDNGLSIWNDDSIPETGGAHWVSQIPSELKQGTIYGVASTLTPYAGWYHFVASGSGLFMWDESNWYRYDTYIKRYIYNFSTGSWQNDTLYYADEERLFGSISTVPNSIYGDPFGRIWIGSVDNGISMYNPQTERFTNYFQANSPLLSNRIISLGYDPLEGRLLIGTPDGLNTLRIGKTVKPLTSLKDVKAFPNPFKPTGLNTVQIVNLPVDSMPRGKNECSIFSSSGALVMKLNESPYARFEWDGKNKAGDIVANGIYYFVVTDADGNVARGKIAVLK